MFCDCFCLSFATICVTRRFFHVYKYINFALTLDTSVTTNNQPNEYTPVII